MNHFLRLGAAFLLVNLLLRAEPIRIIGTDMGGDRVTAALHDYAQGEKLDLVLSLQGSHDSLSRLSTGQADLALVCGDVDATLVDESIKRIPIAYVVASVVVAADSPLTQLTYGQVDGIFGVDGPAGVSVWGDLGNVDAQARQPIRGYVLDVPAGGLALEVMTHAVFHTPAFRGNVTHHTQWAGLVADVRTGQGGIAIIPGVIAPGSGLRAVALARTAGEPAYTPTVANIHAGDYPIRLPIWLCYRVSESARLQPLITFLSGSKFGELLRVEGLVSVAAEPALVNSENFSKSY